MKTHLESFLEEGQPACGEESPFVTPDIQDVDCRKCLKSYSACSQIYDSIGN